MRDRARGLHPPRAREEAVSFCSAFVVLVVPDETG